MRAMFYLACACQHKKLAVETDLLVSVLHYPGQMLSKNADKNKISVAA